MLTKAFWLAAGERAVRTFAQALLAAIGVGAVAFEQVDWPLALSVAGVAALTSVLTSMVAANFGPTEGPSFGPEVER